MNMFEDMNNQSSNQIFLPHGGARAKMGDGIIGIRQCIYFLSTINVCLKFMAIHPIAVEALQSGPPDIAIHRNLENVSGCVNELRPTQHKVSHNPPPPLHWTVDIS